MAVEVTSEALARAGEEGPYSKGRIITSLHFAVLTLSSTPRCRSWVHLFSYLLCTPRRIFWKQVRVGKSVVAFTFLRVYKCTGREPPSYMLLSTHLSTITPFLGSIAPPPHPEAVSGSWNTIKPLRRPDQRKKGGDSIVASLFTYIILIIGCLG
jgi:hypothetical protein